MKLDRVTITGADDETSIESMWRLSNEYPFAEWGILVSEHGTPKGGPRFPSPDWISRLDQEMEPGLMNLSMHVCGSWVRKACAGDWSWLEDPTVAKLLPWIQRIQLNFHSYRHKVVMPDFVDGIKRRNSEVILQGDGVNTDIILCAARAEANVSILHDRSGGAGELPDNWPDPIPGMRNGYAGGLSARNVAEMLKEIARVADDQIIWIDAETRLRTSDDRYLSMGAVHEYLEEASIWVEGR